MTPIGSTRVAAVIGSPVGHSLSPVLHNAAFEASGLDWVFVALEVAPGRAASAIRAMRDLGLAGMSVTMPHKSECAAAVDRLEPAAAALGAVNCVVWDGSDLVGHNTDGAGFLDALRLDLGVDMVTGTGWPFGGPWVTDEDAEDRLVIKKTALTGGLPFEKQFGPCRPQALSAVSEAGQTVSLTDQITSDGWLTWTTPPGEWTLYAVSQKWGGRSVKRAAPGGEGKCINPFSRQALEHYLAPFDAALAALPPGALRCHFHDSFEYLANWSPTLFDEFQARRGYDLRDWAPALAGDGDRETIARVRTDYRETVSDLLLENFTQTWTAWAHGQGSLSRNQAHGSPGNLLDLYGATDIPETEIFGGSGDPRASKSASSAAHVLGKPLASSESCTWLGEHFTVSLADGKAALDRLLLAGINHIFYHGTPYSPADAAWPGWLFYASTTFAPDDPLWHDFPALNAYVTRCQSVLQSGRPDNDVLLYWPLHDLWQTRPDAFMLEINGRWLTDEPIGRTAQTLWESGFAFDYVSDRQLGLAQASGGGIRMPGGRYQAVVVPPCAFMPESTLAALVELADAGATVIFEGRMPSDVPGLGDLAARRARFGSLRSQATHGQGRLFCGPDLETLLATAGVRRETLTDFPGVRCIRRQQADGTDYFLVNAGPDALDGWLPLAAPFQSALLMDPMTGKTGAAQTQGDRYLCNCRPARPCSCARSRQGRSPDWTGTISPSAASRSRSPAPGR